MRLWTATFAFALFFASSAAASPLVGTWESMTTSTGGIGNTLEFTSDGSLKSTIGAMVDFTYTASATELKTVYVDPKTGRRE